MRRRLALAALATAAGNCCCGSCEESCSSAHSEFKAQCQSLGERQSCEMQFACFWERPKPCEDCNSGSCMPSCLEKYLQGFTQFRRSSAATLMLMDGGSPPQDGTLMWQSFNSKEKELLEAGGAKQFRQKKGDDIQAATDAMLLISDASQKVLNCWAVEGRFWYVNLWHPGLGLRSSTMCIPWCCSQAELESDLTGRFFNTLSGTDEQMQNITSMEVSHWADMPLEFVLIGLDGCGTTSLRRNLAKHPDINFTHLNVFSQDEDYFLVEMGRQTLPYMRQVERLVAHRAQMKAEKVGIYQPLMWQEELLEHLLANIPNLRVMVAVCDPLDRFERKLDLEAHAADILEQVHQKVSDTRSTYFSEALRSWGRNFAGRALFIEKDMQAAPETLERITNFLGIRPFPQQVRFKRYNSRGRRRSRLCSHPNLVQNLKGLFEPEYNLLEEILGAAASERLRARRTRCEVPDDFKEDGHGCTLGSAFGLRFEKVS